MEGEDVDHQTTTTHGQPDTFLDILVQSLIALTPNKFKNGRFSEQDLWGLIFNQLSDARIESGTAGWEAQTQPWCNDVPQGLQEKNNLNCF